MAGQPDALPTLKIDCTPVFAIDNLGQPSQFIIDRTLGGMGLKTTIELSGLTAGLFSGHAYTVRFFADSLGAGPNVALLPIVAANFGVIVPSPPGAPTVVPINVPSVSNLPADGVYRLSAVVTVPGANAFAFSDGPLVEIVTP
jgi:hypothetical protein